MEGNRFIPEEAAAARREYQRRWRKANPDKVQAAQMRYWAKKAAEQRQASLFGDVNNTDREVS